MSDVKTAVAPPTEPWLRQAAELLRQGQLVAMPTETVYGLAANAWDGKAVEGIFAAKGRPQDNPLIVHISSMEQLEGVVSHFPKEAEKLAEAFWPGPLTMVLPKSEKLAPQVSAGLDTVGVRMPAHPVAQKLIDLAQIPLAAPSANVSGSPSPTTASHVKNDLDGRIPLVLDGGDCPVGVESTVLSLQGKPTVLRPGFVTPQEIEEVLAASVDVVATRAESCEENFAPPSPGMKYRHYAPRCEVILVDSELDGFRSYVEDRAGDGRAIFALCFEGEDAGLAVPAVTYGKAGDAASQAAALFDSLRRLDALGAEVAYARSPAGGGVGLAVRNRLLRAASFREVRL